MVAALLLALVPSASADAPAPYGSVLLGVGALPDSGDPVNMRVSGRLGIPVAQGHVAGFDMVLPLELATSGQDGIGFHSQTSALELAPTARLRLAPDSPVRVYGDAGLGFVHRFSHVDTWFGNASQGRTVPMFRSGLGFEFGGTGPGALALVVEPIGYRHYGLDGKGADLITFMAGLQFGG